tara:strand:+ start:110 stop:313 length:204 start_codon:yes stop_codon:yes gene_type:complete
MTLKIGDKVQDITTKCKGTLIGINHCDGLNYLVSYQATTEQEWIDQGERWEWYLPTDLIKINRKETK